MHFGFQNSYTQLPGAFYERVRPSPVGAPVLIKVNEELAATLGLDATLLSGEEASRIFAGNALPEDADPIAMVYAGHQFGGFSPRLGDGRAILLGEVVDRDGVRRDIQLKGSGPTPFSRRGDGRSALGPVLREYLVSEAMAALGVPTTRALAAVWSGDKVFRDSVEPGGVFTRVASSHLRIGTFEYFASRGEVENVRLLLDHALERHYPERAGAANGALALLAGVGERQARLIAQWMQVGFIHGVMNTDNMSISGETMDFGPCAFLDEYDPDKKFSFIDQRGRYAFGNQPMIAHWNLARLAEALLPLIAPEEEVALGLARETLELFPEIFRQAYLERMGAKIGIADGGGADWPLVDGLLDLLREQGMDFTLSFRHLRGVPLSGEPLCGDNLFLRLFPRQGPVEAWLARWRDHLATRGVSSEAAAATMRGANPVFVPRNHRIEAVIAAGKEGDFAPFHRLNEILARPFEEQPLSREYELPPEPGEVVRATYCGT